jgi:UDP-glucuronate 4-epimerase
MSKRIAITGAAGFIGFHLSSHLKKLGHEVIGYDNFNSYYDPQLKRAREANLNKIGVEVIDGDICDIERLSSTLEKFSPTHLVHLAAQAGVRYSLENPAAYIQSNITGFLNILEFCRHHPEIPLTYASSSSVYGLNTKIPFSIDDPTDHQASLYGVTKKSNELMAHTYHHLYGIKTTGLRFFTVYGPWGRPDMAYFSFTEKMLAGKEISIFNQGNMRRDFTYIDDIVAGTTAAIDLASPCEIFNLGGHRPEPLSQLITTLETSLGTTAIQVMKPMQPGDVVETYADIDKSKEKLGFYPTTPLSKGIPHFVEWYKNYYSTPTS